MGKGEFKTVASYNEKLVIKKVRLHDKKDRVRTFRDRLTDRILPDLGGDFELSAGLLDAEEVLRRVAEYEGEMVEPSKVQILDFARARKWSNLHYDQVTPDMVDSLKKLAKPLVIAKALRKREDDLDARFTELGLPDFLMKSDYVVGQGEDQKDGGGEVTENGKPEIYSFQEKISDFIGISLSNLQNSFSLEHIESPENVEAYKKDVSTFCNVLFARYTPEQANGIGMELLILQSAFQALIDEGLTLDINGRDNIVITKEGKIKLMDVDGILRAEPYSKQGSTLRLSQLTEHNERVTNYLNFLADAGRNLTENPLEGNN